jgi:hypothetical protein
MSMESFWGDKNERAEDQKEEYIKEGYHDENLFDQNENSAGEKIDLRTGNKINNEKSIKSPHGVRKFVIGKKDPVQDELENDPATAYLRDHGLDEFGNKAA